MRKDEIFEIGADEDQPTSCPFCGARTEFQEEEDGAQKHLCLECGARFTVVFSLEKRDEEED